MTAFGYLIGLFRYLDCVMVQKVRPRNKINYYPIMNNRIVNKSQSHSPGSLLYLNMKVTEVKYLNEYILHIKFEDGVSGEVDLFNLVDKGVFQPLKDQSLFSKAYSTGSSIAWSDELEIDSDTIYLELAGRPIVSR